MATTQSQSGLNGTLSLYLTAVLIFALIVTSYMLAGLSGLVTCVVGLTALICVGMVFVARS